MRASSTPPLPAQAGPSKPPLPGFNSHSRSPTNDNPPLPLNSHSPHPSPRADGFDGQHSPSQHTGPRRSEGHYTHLTSAEAYANAHSKRENREYRHQQQPSGGQAKGTKPILDWISRKLGGGRRPTISEGMEGVGMSSMGSVATPSKPRNNGNTLPARNGQQKQSTNTATVVGRKGSQITPAQIFSHLTREPSVAISRSESHSLRSYSLSYVTTSERERRREANNPYPSLPVPPIHRDSTIDSVSLSFLSRSRTPSTHSDPTGLSLADDSSMRWDAGLGADEDASIRPFPPSHPASPTPSHSVISRSASASLLSPSAPGPAYRTSSQASHAPHARRSVSSFSNSSEGDRLERTSTSTKPTTVLSFDSHAPMAHIAQPQSPPILNGSTPTSPQSPRSLRSERRVSMPLAGPSGTLTPGSSTPPESSQTHQTHQPSLNLVRAPKHSHPDTVNNPHPFSAPGPNASTLTLASSTFNIAPTSASGPLTPGSGSLPSGSGPYPLTASPGHPPVSATTPLVPGPASNRLREISSAAMRPPSLVNSPSVTFAPDIMPERPISSYDYATSVHAISLNGYAPSLSIRTGGWPGGRQGVADSNASVRAVRRKGSWESNESGWSWRAARAQGPGEYFGPSIRYGPMAPALGDADEGVQPGSSLTERDGEARMSGHSLEPARGSDGEETADEGEVATPSLDGQAFELNRALTPIIA